ncbi:putative U-box domain-containing protein 50 [Senna tora]|uniref:RING-type E3 ubiquitin transferase n=1 Tax=Senna tora TaxID=362788 RepID=A0A834WQ39_9FABA|nr:putative U-box domain-containing protein 50 [Senna tora]
MEAIQTGKIHVAVGNDLQDGIKTLHWALNKWKSHPISIVILHVNHNNSRDYVYTPFGRLPSRSVSDEKLAVLKKIEQEKVHKLLSKYIACCGKVPAETIEVEKFDETIQKRIVDLISSMKITKLIMGFSLIKPSSKSRGAISGLFYVHQHKPDFCELFIICGGKQVFFRGQSDEKIMEDDNGVMVARMKDKVTFKDWLERMFTEKSTDSPISRISHGSSTSSAIMDSPVSQNQWEFYLQEIESYFQDLLSSNLDEQSFGEQDSDISQTSPQDTDITQQNNSNTSGAEKIQILKTKLNEAHKTIQLKRKEAKDNLERHAKAEWAICLCNTRVEELESKIKEERSKREELVKEVEAEKEKIYEKKGDVEERKRRLSSLVELQSEVSSKFQICTLSKSRAEAQLEKAAMARSEMVREIEELRRQRDVLNRRIEFCKDKDAIGTAARLTQPTSSFREYTAQEIRLATDNFSDRLRLKSGGDWTNVYRGRINHSTVAIKMLNSVRVRIQYDQVGLLSSIRHPHVVAMVGFCSELKCIVMEYMHNGSLRDMLFSRRRNHALPWHDRIRIATEVCSGLGFLHAAQPKGLIHGHLTPSSVLLDRNLVAKIKDIGPNECSYESDIRALGVLILHLLTGRNWMGVLEEAMTMDREALVGVVDGMGGEWPLDVAQKLAGLAIRCMGKTHGPEPNIRTVMEELNEIRREGEDVVVVTREGEIVNGEGSSDVPSVFLCPILQEVMRNPHVAADGFSYELEAIEEWVHSGHDTSPITNSRLNHLFLTPNQTLRSLIHDWQTKTSLELAN